MSNKPSEIWETRSLGEISTFRRGSFPQPYGKPEWYDDNGYPFVQVYDINENNKLNSKTKSRISEEASKKSVFIKKGSLIVSLQGSIGRVAITQYDAFVDRTILIFNDFEKYLDKKFFMYTIKKLFLKQAEIADGGVIKTITKQTLKNFEISIPPLPEQKKIAEILSTVDMAISKFSLKLSKLNLIAESIMESIEESSLSNNVIKVKIGDISTKVGSGITPRGGSNIYLKKGVKLIRSQNVLKMKLSLSNVVHIPISIHQQMHNSSIKTGDTLLNLTGASIGRSAVVPSNLGEANVNQHVCIIRTNENCNPYYLSAWLNSKRGQRQINIFL